MPHHGLRLSTAIAIILALITIACLGAWLARRRGEAGDKSASKFTDREEV
jgi:FtsZ-interacting cell division protein ZipA